MRFRSERFKRESKEPKDSLRLSRDLTGNRTIALIAKFKYYAIIIKA